MNLISIKLRFIVFATNQPGKYADPTLWPIEYHTTSKKKLKHYVRYHRKGKYMYVLGVPI